jgi:serine protease Do
MLLSDVVPEGPAATAGLRGGDRIVAVGATEVRNVHDFMFILQSATPGEQTTVTLLRNGQRMRVTVTFGQPRTRR